MRVCGTASWNGVIGIIRRCALVVLVFFISSDEENANVRLYNGSRLKAKTVAPLCSYNHAAAWEVTVFGRY